MENIINPRLTSNEEFLDTLDPEEIKLILGRKWKSILPDIVKFFFLYKNRITRKRTLEFEINQNSYKNIAVFGSQQNISNLIKKMKDINLLKCIDENYRYNVKEYSYSKNYIFNFIQFDIIYRLYKNSSNNYNNINNNINNQIMEIFDKYCEINASSTKIRLKRLKKKYFKFLKISSNLLKENLNGYIESKDLFEQLKINDWRIRETQKEVNLINEYYSKIKDSYGCCYWELFTKYYPTIEYEGELIKKIGIRANSLICTFPKDESKEINRGEALERIFEDGKIYKKDINGSIFRLTYWLNHINDSDGFHFWLLDGMDDIYEELNGEPFKDKEERKIFKKLAMFIYFDEGSDAKLARDIKGNDDLKDYFSNVSQEEMIYRVKYYRERFHNILGDFYGSDIFVTESYMYSMITRMILEKGHKVAQIYDCWYFSDANEIDFYELMKEAITNFKNNILELN